MKKILLPAICLLLILTSCKKKNDTIPVNTITATVDGVAMNFNVNVAGHVTYVPQGPNSTTLSVQGATAAQIPAGGIAFSLTSASLSNITKGTYTIDSYKNNPPVWVYLSYGYDGPGQPDQPYFTDSSGGQPTTITITSVSSTNLQGTFSGTLVYSQGGSTTKTVTNGKFNVNIH